MKKTSTKKPMLTEQEELQLRCYKKKILTFDSLPERLKQKILKRKTST